MNKLFCFLICIFFILNCLSNKGTCQTTHQSLNDTGFAGMPVLPGVSGFGLDTKGGQGGKIIVVKNLNPNGEGSLAEALAFNGPRIIVFEVAGYINLVKKSLKIKNPYITIAGQTAPSPGITLINGGLGIGTHDVIIQHIKVRPGEAGAAKKGGWRSMGSAQTEPITSLSTIVPLRGQPMRICRLQAPGLKEKIRRNGGRTLPIKLQSAIASSPRD